MKREELLLLLDPASEASTPERRAAIACYLSAGEGWRDAAAILGGAFAPDDTGLRERKAD